VATHGRKSKDQSGPFRAAQFFLLLTAGFTCGYSGLARSGPGFKNRVKLHLLPKPAQFDAASIANEPERGVYAASTFASPRANRFANDVRTLKRPEGRAPMSLHVTGAISCWKIT
jgi:hypothetical protein